MDPKVKCHSRAVSRHGHNHKKRSGNCYPQRASIDTIIRRFWAVQQTKEASLSLPSFSAQRQPALARNPGMEASPSPASSPLLRYYDDRAILTLEPLHDAFIARDLEQRRLSKTQEEEWTARIVKDVQRDERAVRPCPRLRVLRPQASQLNAAHLFLKTKVVESWLRATSLSDRREFCNFAPQLTDENFQLFVRFFWFVKIRDQRKANKLLFDTRKKWGLEAQFHEGTANKLMEDPSYPIPSSLYWTRNPTGQVHGFKAGKRKAVSYKLSPIMLVAAIKAGD